MRIIIQSSGFPISPSILTTPTSSCRRSIHNDRYHPALLISHQTHESIQLTDRRHQAWQAVTNTIHKQPLTNMLESIACTASTQNATRNQKVTLCTLAETLTKLILNENITDLWVLEVVIHFWATMYLRKIDTTEQMLQATHACGRVW